MKRNLRNQSYEQDHSTLFQNQKGLTVGACHDVRDLSYDNYLYIS